MVRLGLLNIVKMQPNLNPELCGKLKWTKLGTGWYRSANIVSQRDDSENFQTFRRIKNSVACGRVFYPKIHFIKMK